MSDNHFPGPSRPANTLYKKGDLIGQRYKVYGILGRGGFGIVYLVYKLDSKCVYALKTFRDDLMADSGIRERFHREAQIWVDLGRHPFLVRAHFINEVDFRLFIAMEFISPGENGLNSLERYFRRQPPDLAQSLRWAIQFCHGMEYAYSRGIRSHRDIKPANILIDRENSVKISDFGLASMADEVRVLGEGGMGTPAYMPPEQFLSSGVCEQRSDIYSFGVVLYQMASGGKLPLLAPLPENNSHEEIAGFYREMFRLHSKVPPAALSSPLDPIIRRCMEKKPSRRYLNFSELRAELEPLLRNSTGETVEFPSIQEMDAGEWNDKGMSLSHLGLHEEAAPCYGKALELDPFRAAIWNNKAINLRETGRYTEAAACFDKALELEPRSAMVWNNKGGTLLAEGRVADALACYQKAIELNPKYAIAWHNRGFALNSLARFEEAIGCFDGALEINPRSIFSWYQKGNALRSLGRSAEAAAWFGKAAELDPQYALQALHHFDRALELNPRDAMAWYNKAEAEERLSMKPKAADSYRHYLELSTDPYSPQMEFARIRMRELGE
jgi:serine/threonine protein kinase